MHTGVPVRNMIINCLAYLHPCCQVTARLGLDESGAYYDNAHGVACSLTAECRVSVSVRQCCSRLWWSQTFFCLSLIEDHMYIRKAYLLLFMYIGQRDIRSRILKMFKKISPKNDWSQVESGIIFFADPKFNLICTIYYLAVINDGNVNFLLHFLFFYLWLRFRFLIVNQNLILFTDLQLDGQEIDYIFIFITWFQMLSRGRHLANISFPTYGALKPLHFILNDGTIFDIV
jgi:hypothetical protein